ncbi:hypothetical protein D9758_015766 [Tetrapyrgos nigripes]|uniref:HAT C-terminal dimerisation domain-containing protein n=1 Tax=Tetrapyrgos nigripes TaxID=182062 RepID=A0A8H5CAS9_9AGAR|nr:hypothetical protein D9758_015766 [Tetrapyrgos nigripes]
MAPRRLPPEQQLANNADDPARSNSRHNTRRSRAGTATARSTSRATANRSTSQQRPQTNVPDDIIHDNGALETAFQLQLNVSSPPPPPPPIPLPQLRVAPPSSHVLPTPQPASDAIHLPQQHQRGDRQAVTFALDPIPRSPGSGSEGEAFDFSGVNHSSSSDDEDQRPETPTRPSATRSTTPRQHTPHTPSRRHHGRMTRTPNQQGRMPNFIAHAHRPSSARRVGTKRSDDPKTNDVHKFVRKDSETQRKYCTFCELLQESNPNHPVKSYEMSTGISNIRNHFSRAHKDVWFAACDRFKFKVGGRYKLDYESWRHDQNLPAAEVGGGNIQAEERVPFSMGAFVDALVDFIVADDQSIYVVENPQFRRLLLLLREELRDEDIPSRETIRQRILQKWNQYIEYMQNRLKAAVGKIALTEDMWSDPNLRGFMALTAHWIEGKPATQGGHLILSFECALIGFLHVPGKHTGKHLARGLMFLCERLQIIPKLGGLTMDNASVNNTTAVEFANELNVIWPSVEWDSHNDRLRCFPHIINLACQAAIEVAEDKTREGRGVSANLTGALTTLRSGIREIRKSGQRRDDFQDLVVAQFQQTLQPLRDVKTRWSSTQLMLKQGRELSEVMEKFLSNPTYGLMEYVLSQNDWKALDQLSCVLAVPHNFQQLLSKERTLTLCDVLPFFMQMIELWEELKVQLPDMVDVIDVGLAKLRDYQAQMIDVPSYTYAMVVNPEIKFDYFHALNDGGNRLRGAKQMVVRKLSTYRGSADVQPSHSLGTGHLSEAEAMFTRRGRHNVTRDSTVEEELNAYLADPTVGTTSLNYWQERQKIYPTLFKLAMDVLPLQASAVPCERVFSSAKETITDRRNKLSPILVEALQMLKFALRHADPLNFTSHFTVENETEELILTLDAEARVSSDVQTFIRELMQQ